MNVSAVLGRLGRVRRSGAGWSAQCPAHEDRNPSLSVTEGADGRVLLKCFAGCTLPEICAAMGIGERDLFPEDRGTEPSIVVAHHAYRDETGALLFEVVKYSPKGFRQRTPDGRGGWNRSTHGVRQVPYRLPELLASQPRRVFVVEGEKDADRLAALGFIATTNAGGAGKWKPEFSAFFRGRHVIILPDNDEPGRHHADSVARSIHGTAASVRMLCLPNLPPKGDVSDWLAKGGTRNELISLVRATPEWVPVLVGNDFASGGYRLVSMTTLLDEPDEPTRWLVDGLLPFGGVSLLAAKPKAGKSTLALQLAVDVSRGTPFLGRCTMKGAVVVLAFEEKRGEARRHLRDLGATRDDPVYIHFGSAPEEAMAALRPLVEQHRPVLLVVDTLFRLAGVKDVSDYAAVTKVLTPLLDLAREFGVHLLLLHHQGKGARSGVDVPLGSTAIAGSVDSILDLRRREDDRWSLATVQRYGTDLPETMLDFDPEARRSTLGGTKAEEDEARISAEILAALEGKAVGIQEDPLFEDVDGRTGAKRQALRKLVSRGQVDRAGDGKKGSPFRYSRNARFLVPDISLERENENPKNGETPRLEGLDSRSEIPAGGPHDGDGKPDQPEQESEDLTEEVAI